MKKELGYAIGVTAMVMVTGGISKLVRKSFAKKSKKSVKEEIKNEL